MIFDLLITDCHLATMQPGVPSYGIIEKGAIAIQGEKIAWVGKEQDLPSRQAANYHGMDGAWITPGLIDCHTHFIFGGNRIADFEARNNGRSYAEIAASGGGILSTMRATRSAELNELLDNARARIAGFLSEGVTSMEIKSGYGLTLKDEMKSLEAATLLGTQHHLTIQRTFLGAHSLPPEFSGRANDYIQLLVQEWLPELHSRHLIDAVDGFCETIAFNPAQIEILFQKAHALGLKVKLHAEQLSYQGGTSLAARYQALSADHLEYAGENDIIAMAKSGTVAVLLPGAFYALRETKMPPIALMRQYNVPIALASDHNPGTSPLASLLPALNLGVTLFGLSPEEALSGVTSKAALALGLTDRGTIEPGKKADLAAWHISHPAELSYWIGSKPCTLRIQAGKIR